MSSTSDTRSLTALQGVAAVTVLNLLSKTLQYARHVAITAFLGLTAWLDAFYVAVSLVSIFINTFGDIFDSAGIPALVKTRENRGIGPFRALASQVFRFSVRFAGILCLAMLLCSPLIPWMVPGFSLETVSSVRSNLWFLIPYALLFLPYHCLGSFFRSVRRFHLFSLVDLLVSVAALLVFLLLPGKERAVPLSLSVAYAGGFLLFFLLGRKDFLGGEGEVGTEMATVRKTVAGMTPIYLVGHLAILIDKYFASHLDPGSVSALQYGLILALSLPLIASIDRVFVTSLSEDTDRGGLLTLSLSGVWIVSLPAMAFAWVHSTDIVRLLFERGAFGLEATETTTEAFRYYALGIPFYFFWPLCARTLQIHGKIRTLLAASMLTISLNCVLNYIFLFELRMGIKGIALATCIAMYIGMAPGLRGISRSGVRIRFAKTMAVGAAAAAALSVAFVACRLLPLEGFGKFAVLPRAAVYSCVYLLVVFRLPGEEMNRVREAIFHSFPGLGRVIGRAP